MPGLFEIYKKSSKAKLKAYENRKDKSFMLCDILCKHGETAILWNWGVISYNTNMFVYAGIIRVEDSNGGISWRYHIETPTKSYCIKVI